MASMKFVDITALADATVSITSAIGNAELFKNRTTIKDYATFEKNAFVLDGSKTIMGKNPGDVAHFSKEKSNSSCAYNNERITVTFSEKHTSAGVTIYFGNVFPKKINITWYALTGEEIDSEVFYPDTQEYFCKKQVQEYGKIIITFLESFLPERYARIQYIEYGALLNWTDDVIKSAKCVEEKDNTSITLPINTAEMTIIDTENDFDIGNENGAWKSIQKLQEVSIVEHVDGETKNIGTYYIDTMSFANNEATFNMIDTVGTMDKSLYSSDRVFGKEKAGVLIQEIMTKAGVAKYNIDNEVANMVLSGYIPKQTCREALQIICFACGAVADDSRSDTISIYKPNRYVSSYIGTDRKFYGDSNVELDEYITGVQIEYNQYAPENEVKEICTEDLSVGVTKIEFSEPHVPESIIASTGEILEVTTDYVIIEVKEPAECTVSGKKYAETKLLYTHTTPGENGSVKKIGVCTVYNREQLQKIAEYLVEYYKLRKKVKMRYLLEEEKVGNWVNVKDIYGQVATTAITKQEIDLAGGYVATATCRGYSIVVSSNYYAGKELYAGSIGLI